VEPNRVQNSISSYRSCGNRASLGEPTVESHIEYTRAIPNYPSRTKEEAEGERKKIDAVGELMRKMRVFGEELLELEEVADVDVDDVEE